jgi:hypothetical protein
MCASGDCSVVINIHVERQLVKGADGPAVPLHFGSDRRPGTL